MSEAIDPRLEEVFSGPPLSTEQLLPASTSQLLYDMYTERIADFPGFGQRPFNEAREDFEKTIIESEDGADIEFVRMVLTQLVQPEAYVNLKQDIGHYWQQHGLEKDLKTYSYCIVTNHRFFSDLPVIAGAIRDLRREDPYAARRNLMVVGKMIPGMNVDIFRNGQPFDVTPLLAMAARQLQSVPKLPEDATEAMKAQRRIWNEDFKKAATEAATTPGNILYIAASGSHDVPKGDRLEMQSVNQETAKLLCTPRLKVIPMYFSCDSFGPEGIEPAVPKYRLLPPRTLHEEDQVYELMAEFATIGTELLAEEFPKGVYYRRDFVSRAKKFGRQIMHQD